MRHEAQAHYSAIRLGEVKLEHTQISLSNAQAERAPKRGHNSYQSQPSQNLLPGGYPVHGKQRPVSRAYEQSASGRTSRPPFGAVVSSVAACPSETSRCMGPQSHRRGSLPKLPLLLRRGPGLMRKITPSQPPLGPRSSLDSHHHHSAGSQPSMLPPRSKSAQTPVF